MSFIGIRPLKNAAKGALEEEACGPGGCHFTDQQAAFKFNATLTESQSRVDVKG
jgi:hypothetical protein